MTSKEHQSDPIPVNPLLKRLTEADTVKDRVVVLAGYIGPAPEGRVRIYPDLGTKEYIEAARDDVIYWRRKSGEPDSPAVIYFSPGVELTHVSRFLALDLDISPDIYDLFAPVDEECVDECVAEKLRKCEIDAYTKARQMGWDLGITALEMAKCRSDPVMAGFNHQCRSECRRSRFTLPEGAYGQRWRRAMGG